VVVAPPAELPYTYQIPTKRKFRSQTTKETDTLRKILARFRYPFFLMPEDVKILTNDCVCATFCS